MRSLHSLVRQTALALTRKRHGDSRPTPAQVLALCALLAPLAAPLSAHALTVTGSLAADTVWSVSQSPITVQGHVTLDQDATLTIEPGVQVRMAPSASFTLQRGAVRALGTPAQPIVITSAQAVPAPGDWGIWRFTEGTRSPQTRWDHVRVEYGSGIAIEKSSPALNHVAVLHHRGPAIRMDLASSPAGVGLRAQGNTLNAVVVPAGVIAGQVAWALVGIPYLVEQGLVEIGQAQMAIEPAELNLAPSSRWPMRLVLRQPAPAGGRVVTLSSSGSASIDVPPSVTLAAGASRADFTVSSSGSITPGIGFITALHPDLGVAAAKVQVSGQSVVGLGLRNTVMLVNGPYAAAVQLSTPAPAGGVAVQLLSSPPGALRHPATVMVPQGEASAEFSVQGNAPHAGASLSAQAAGYYSRGAVELQFVDQVRLGLDGSQDTIVVGEEVALQLTSAVPAAPRDGLRVQVISSNPAVLAVTPGEAVVAGQAASPTLAPSVTYKGVALGTATIEVTGTGVERNRREIRVRKPTVLSLESGAANGKVTLGSGLSGRVRVLREIDAESFHGSGALWVTVLCEDAAVCTGQNVYIPSGVNSVDVTLTGHAAGSTRLIAQAPRALTATAGVKVVKPQLVWQSRWSSDADPGEPTLDARRYMGERHGFRLCLSVPEAAPYNRQKLSGPSLVMDISLPEQSPAGLVSGIYAQDAGGLPVREARIESGSACSEPLYVGEATQLGRYRIGWSLPDGTSGRSNEVQVRADHQVEMRAACGDCVDMVVVQGFLAKFEVYTTHFGNSVPPAAPLDVELQCADAALCTSQPMVQILPNDQALVEVAGRSAGMTELRATVNPPQGEYPETGVAKIRVVPPMLSFAGEGWDSPVSDAAVGRPQSYEVCISEPRWGVRSYPRADLAVELLTSNAAVASPSQAARSWPAGVPCIYVEMQFASAGTARLTVNVQGVPSHTVRFEVQP